MPQSCHRFSTLEKRIDSFEKRWMFLQFFRRRKPEGKCVTFETNQVMYSWKAPTSMIKVEMACTQIERRAKPSGRGCERRRKLFRAQFDSFSFVGSIVRPLGFLPFSRHLFRLPFLSFSSGAGTLQTVTRRKKTKKSLKAEKFSSLSHISCLLFSLPTSSSKSFNYKTQLENFALLSSYFL